MSLLPCSGESGPNNAPSSEWPNSARSGTTVILARDDRRTPQATAVNAPVDGPPADQVDGSGALTKLAGMASTGLRELKKARTFRHIADTAARLLAERGYENVAVTDVAREAEVAEQTVYNYFPTKEQLVTDRDQQVQERLSDLIRSRPAGITAAAAARDFILGFVAGIRDIPPEQWRGELGYLAAISPAVRRLALEMTGRQAAVLAAAISHSTAVRPEIASLQGIALAGVFQIIISESGRRTREGQSQAQIADELYPVVENLLDELDRWFTLSASSAPSRS